jgi:HD-GYP domain-containing protein (c-di-GMP phosphodiesterase class II)
VAVADCFDAMTSHRPYRRALSRTYACAELRRCAGSQFDAVVVEALIRRLDDVGEVATVVGADSDESARRGAELEAVR